MTDYRTTIDHADVQDECLATIRLQNAFINRVYGWMCAGLALTGALAWLLAADQRLIQAIASNQLLFFGICLAELLLVLGLTAAINRISAVAATVGFLAYAVLNSVLFSMIFLLYTGESIAATFFATSLTFGAASLYGYLTKRDLSTVGRFVFMALCGFLIGTLINLFWANSTLYWILTYCGIFIFAGLTAYDTQKIRAMALAASRIDGETSRKIAIMGALALYLDFINLFLLLLRLFGRRR